MPELPEVETIRRDLTKVILHHQITNIEIHKPKLIKNKTITEFKTSLLNHHFNSVKRIGKLLYLELSNRLFLLIHLKMTGQLIHQKSGHIVAGGHNYPAISQNLPNKYSHIVFSFDNQSRLFFNDQRQFGYMKIVDHSELSLIKKTYGIEPLQKNFNLINFQKIFSNRHTNLKNILLNQQIISGLGNIYVDEICFDAKIRPQTKAHQLKPAQIKKLFLSTSKIIRQAIKYRGTTFSDYVDSKGVKGNYSQKLQVYGRSKQPCLICQKGIIKKIKLAGRGTHFCPVCQK